MIEIEIDKDSNNLTTFKCDDFKVDILDYRDILYTNFFNNYMTRNLPCVVKNVSSNWECTTEWINDKKINYEYLASKYGDLEAPVADCGSITYNAQKKSKMTVRDYISYLKSFKRERLLYLKDWHLRRLRPEDTFYDIPNIFASDWLNEFAIDHQEDDFMFVYIGPKDSWTPLHVDVYNSYSWSVNVIGRKKWILLPPGEEIKLKDSLGNLPLLFENEKFENITYLEVLQEMGDALFVPSGWHHQVVNQLDTISINHNWINACNIEAVWAALQTSLLSVENEIREFKNTPEYTSQCQLILKSLFGMDFLTFINFLCYMGKKRLSQLQGGEQISFNNFRLGINHITFDISIIFKMMSFIQNLPLHKYLSKTKECDFIDIKNKISKKLKNKVVPM